MRLIIAEKPSVSASIAHAIGASRPFGNKYNIKCYQNEEYIVTNALGHLYDIGEPADYGFKEWSLETLPILPDSFGTYPTLNEAKTDYAKALGKQRQLLHDFMVSDLVTEIICATDAGREGELIFRYIYNANRCEKPVKRLWVSSLTDEAIKTAMHNLKPDGDYDNLYLSGITRAKCDWIYGMNLSRLYSLLDDEVHRVGRVKVPVLSLIVNRDKAIKAHTPENYFKITLENGAEAKDDYKSEDEAKIIADSLRGKNFTVTKAETKTHTENPPLLFSLNTLQQEANNEHGLTAGDTLKAAQSMYEKKLITYPRTASEVLSEDMESTVENVIRLLEPLFPGRVKALPSPLNIGKRILDNTGVTDHHAIIPTTQANKSIKMTLNENERTVFNIICDRLLCAVDSAYVYEQTDYIFSCNSVDFMLKAISDVNRGWKSYHMENHKIPEEYVQGDSFTPPSDSIQIVKKVKEPPKHYTDASLLSVLETNGLGTPATRTNIIEELFSAGYIERKGKGIYSTPFGAEFADSLPASLKDMKQTAKWEESLSKIEKCSDKNEALNIANALYESIAAFVKSTISQAIEHKSERKPLVNTNPKATNRGRIPLGKCPKCAKDVFEGKQNFYCESSGKDHPCFTLWKTSKFLSFEVTAKIVTELLKKGKAEVSYKDELSGEKLSAKYTLFEGKNGSYYLNRVSE
jgi:DNA topoisomerase-3